MQPDPAAVRRAVAVREAAFKRVRIVSVGVLAGAAAVAGVFAALAAGSSHVRKIVSSPHRDKSSHASTTPIVAPAPSLVAVGGGSPQPSPAPPAQPPETSSAPPVAVSAGS